MHNRIYTYFSFQSLNEWQSTTYIFKILTFSFIRCFEDCRESSVVKKECSLFLQRSWGSVPSTHIRHLTIAYNSSSQRSDGLFWPLQVPDIHLGAHTYIQSLT